MANLLDLPREILHSILVECDPTQLGPLCRTSKQLNANIKGNRLLYKELYLRHYDAPPLEPTHDEPNWEAQLHNIVSLKHLLESESVDVKRRNIPIAAKTISHLLETSAVPTPPHRTVLSQNLAFLKTHFPFHLNSSGKVSRQAWTPAQASNFDALLCSSSLFKGGGSHMQIDAPDFESRQRSAQLHVLFGVNLEAEQHNPTHPYARSCVYDLRNYTDGTLWGPFLDDGKASVDWEKLESIVVLLGYNLNIFHQRTSKRFPLLWHTPWAGIAPRSFISPPPSDDASEPPGEFERLDPYHITGTWMRVVCFLDYSDLYSYNFNSPTPPDGMPRPPLETEEAIRLITMKLRVTRIEPPGEGMGQDLPCVHFQGVSRSMHAGWDPNANSSIRGTVSQTLEGHIRWTTFSVFHGEERWRSEGVQLGGLRSARGVWGHWFDKDFDTEGPAGPTAFWKLTDELPPPEPNTPVGMPVHVLHMHHNTAHSHTHNHPPWNTGFGVAAGGATPQIAVAARGSASGRDTDPANTVHPFHQTLGSDDEEEVELEGEDESGEEPDIIDLTAGGVEIMDVEGADGEGPVTITTYMIEEEVDEQDDDYRPPS